jgi:dihydrofolate reductase
MKVTMFLASSLNGIIARPDYSEDFLSRDHWEGFLECAQRTGAVVWGRRTHERVTVFNKDYLDRMWELEKIVVSRKAGFDPGPGFEVVDSPESALALLEERGATQATLAGGSVLNSAFVQAGLVDEVILNIEAVIVGEGITLLAPGTADLRLAGSPDFKRVSERIVQLRYGVEKVG